MKSKLFLLTIIVHFFSSLSVDASDYKKGFEALEKEKYEEAIYYLSFFASNGDSVAQYNMGILYRDGLGVEVNSQVALAWFNLAAQQRHTLANFAIAKLLQKNADLHSTELDPLYYLKEASFLGHAIAPLEVGNFYYSRQDSPHDLVRAIVWWMLSLERNAPGASENISEISSSLDENQMDAISVKLAECDSQTLRKCLTNF